MLIPREVLEVHHIASTDETRPSISKVHAERSGPRVDGVIHPRLTATDGHRLITVTWHEPKNDEAPPADFGDLTTVSGFSAEIPAETCKEIARVTPGSGAIEILRHSWLEETNEAGLIRMGAGDRAFGQAVKCTAKTEEGEFPDWRQVMHVAGAVKIGINAKLLAELLRTISKVSGEVGVVLHIPADPTSAIGIHVDRADGCLHVDAVIMPMRLDLTGRPDWEDVPTVPGTPAPVKPPEKVQGELPADEVTAAVHAAAEKSLKDPKFLRTLRDACPDGQGGLTSITLSDGQGNEIGKLTPETRKNIDKALKGLKG